MSVLPIVKRMENSDLSSGTFRLKSRELMDKYGKEKTLYRVHKDGDVNYTTILRWINEPETVDRVRSDILFSFLMGLGLSLEEIKNLPLGEIFDLETPPGV